MSSLLNEVWKLLKIPPSHAAPYQPKTDGLVEQFNQTLKQMLRKFISSEPKQQDKLLPFVVFAYWEAPRSSIGCSPMSSQCSAGSSLEVVWSVITNIASITFSSQKTLSLIMLFRYANEGPDPGIRTIQLEDQLYIYDGNSPSEFEKTIAFYVLCWDNLMRLRCTSEKDKSLEITKNWSISLSPNCFVSFFSKQV